MKNIKRLLFFSAAICLLIACSKSDGFLGSGSFENTLKIGHQEPMVDLKFKPGTVYNLTGLTIYKTWTVKEGIVIQDGKYECTGTLEILEDRNFIFSFLETGPDGNAATFSGKISASGELSFKFPAPVAVLPDGTELYITDVLRSHACVIDIWGPGVNERTLFVRGKFDGKRLTAETRFMALINDSCPDLFNPTYNGIVHWIFGYDLCVN